MDIIISEPEIVVQFRTLKIHIETLFLVAMDNSVLFSLLC